MSKFDEIRLAAEADLITFIQLVHPMRVLGAVHKELIDWWTRPDALSHQLVLLPRDHAKSTMLAYRVAWEITKDPSIRVLYISSTHNLAKKQLKFIKDIFDSPIYRRYWPEMTHPDEGKRAKWTETEIEVDHPKRKAEAVRDPTIFTAGLNTSITGLHCDISCLDDVVVKENAYTETGREKVKEQYSLLTSIEGSDARQWVVGTRYFPEDLYYEMKQMIVEEFSETGEITLQAEVYEIFERQVENAGDGTGEYLWPRQQRYDGKWFGFNQSILAKKRATYLDKMQFRAQYYNNPTNPADVQFKPELFQYYETHHVKKQAGRVFFKGRPLNCFAAIDFAFSVEKAADYTSIVVVGIDSDSNVYILDIDRFKTDSIKEYFDRILKIHNKWEFRKLRAEVNVAQQVIVKHLKKEFQKYGVRLTVEEHRPTVREGTKDERIIATLLPKYENLQMFHYRGGNCQVLEEELSVKKPSHDDVKDALANAVDITVAPTSSFGIEQASRSDNNVYHARFGGIR